MMRGTRSTVVVHEDPVITFSVLAKRFSVIAGDDNERAIRMCLVERVDQAADFGVHVSDFTQVGIVRIT